MTEQHDHEHYRIWFNRVGRGIALVGPSLILLIIVATFVTRLFERPEEAAGPSVTDKGEEQASRAGGSDTLMTHVQDLPTTPATESHIQVAPSEAGHPR